MGSDFSASAGRSLALAYVRVSVTQGREEGGDPETGRDLFSPEAQMDSARKYAGLRNLALDEALSLQFMDLDESAFRQPWQKRPGMAKLVEYARRRQFTDLICWKINRLARNMKEGLELLDLFEGCGVTVHFVSEMVSGDTASGRLLRQIMMAVAEWESVNIGENVKSAFLVRAKSGKPHGRPPSWVRIDLVDGVKHVRTDPAGAASLLRLFELRLQSFSYARAARTLNAEGYRRPIEQRLEERGAPRLPWTSKSVHLALKEGRLCSYCGSSLYGQRRDAWDPDRVEIADCWPALVDRDTVERLRRVGALSTADSQALFGQKEARPHRRLGSSPYLLTGMAYCHYCGYRLNGFNRVSGAAAYYRCSEGASLPDMHPLRRAPGEHNLGGGGYTVVAAALERSVFKILYEAYEFDQGNRNLPPKRVLKAPPPPPPRDIEQAMLRLSQAYEGGAMPLDILKKRMAELEAERAARYAASRAGLMEEATRVIPQHKAGVVFETSALNAALRVFISRIEFPIVTGELSSKTLSATNPRNTPLRFVRVYFHEGFCDSAVCWQAPVRRVTYRGEIPVSRVYDPDEERVAGV